MLIINQLGLNGLAITPNNFLSYYDNVDLLNRLFPAPQNGPGQQPGIRAIISAWMSFLTESVVCNDNGSTYRTTNYTKLNSEIS